MKKKILIGIALVVVLAQLYRPERNISATPAGEFDIAKTYNVPQNVQQILDVACYDCHSNNTRYPWYANIQPVASFMANHVDEGKHELNFNEFTKRRVAIQNHKLEEVVEMIKEGEMPISSYTITHTDARLTTEQKQTLINWATSIMDTLKATYPADSLVLKRRGS